MNGFSVCNKLKRDAALKEVPLIIMSSDSTEETFEQHRRLRTRAEDYLHKPIGFDALLARIRPFVAIGDPGPAPDPAGEAANDPSSDAAIVLDDDIEIDEAQAAEESPDAQSAIRESMDDQEVSDFADQAFGALEAAPPSALPDSEVLIDEPEIAEPELAEPGIAEPELAQPELAEVAEPEVAAPEVEGSDGDVTDVEIDELEIEEANVSQPQIVQPELTEPEVPEPSGTRPEANAVEVEDAELEPQPASLQDLEPLAVPAPVATSRPPMPARIPSLRPSTTPRVAELGDTSKYREEIERQRARIKELEELVRSADAKSADKRGGAKDSEVQRLQRELDEAKARSASIMPGGARAPRASSWICASS